MFFFNPIVDKLNLLARQHMDCNEGKIEKWRIECASNFKVTFLDAKLLSKRTNEYELTGQLIYDDSFQNEVSDANIQYGSLKADICKTKEIGVTDSIGKFKIQVRIAKDKFITFHSLGSKAVYILLDIDK